MQAFDIDEGVLKNFLDFVAESYNPSNKYHNARHAADVLQSAHFMVGKGGLGKYITELEKLSLFVAAMVHDLGHDG